MQNLFTLKYVNYCIKINILAKGELYLLKNRVMAHTHTHVVNAILYITEFAKMLSSISYKVDTK